MKRVVMSRNVCYYVFVSYVLLFCVIGTLRVYSLETLDIRGPDSVAKGKTGSFTASSECENASKWSYQWKVRGTQYSGQSADIAFDYNASKVNVSAEAWYEGDKVASGNKDVFVYDVEIKTNASNDKLVLNEVNPNYATILYSIRPNGFTPSSVNLIVGSYGTISLGTGSGQQTYNWDGSANGGFVDLGPVQLKIEVNGDVGPATK